MIFYFVPVYIRYIPSTIRYNILTIIRYIQTKIWYRPISIRYIIYITIWYIQLLSVLRSLLIAQINDKAVSVCNT